MIDWPNKLSKLQRWCSQESVTISYRIVCITLLMEPMDKCNTFEFNRDHKIVFLFYSIISGYV